jgi:SAM-dependent methyltransferase
MNFVHRRLCSSARWKNVLQHYALPWALDQIDLGRDVLEIGPGYGAATEVLLQPDRHLTCIESDRNLAQALSLTFKDNITVHCEDATASSLPDSAFDGVVCFTMFHHVKSPALQDRLFAEAARVLKPGGVFAGTDSLKSRFMTLLHVFDTLVPVDPQTLPQRLTTAGFENVHVDVNPHAFRFRAWKPRIA